MQEEYYDVIIMYTYEKNECLDDNKYRMIGGDCTRFK